MAYYSGRTYTDAEVSIGPPTFALLRNGAAGPFTRWFVVAQDRADICYFSIYSNTSLVGQIFLHDVNPAGERLIGFHMFDPAQRGRGIGTKALTMLKRFVIEQTELRRLVIITSQANLGSQAIARRCGFLHTGAPREDHEDGMVFELHVVHNMSSSP
jgi:RimJ/RimL family protein N-acetyltransferase